MEGIDDIGVLCRQIVASHFLLTTGLTPLQVCCCDAALAQMGQHPVTAIQIGEQYLQLLQRAAAVQGAQVVKHWHPTVAKCCTSYSSWG
jgi:hypothetical protein